MLTTACLMCTGSATARQGPSWSNWRIHSDTTTTSPLPVSISTTCKRAKLMHLKG